MNDDRIDNLEIKLAFQDKAINDLNQVLYDQQKEIDWLKAMVETLIKGRTDQETGPANEKPPHY